MKPDYKNWIPKGMLVSLIAGTVLSLALLLVFGAFGVCVSGKLRVVLGVVFGIAFVVCAKYTQWCVYAYRSFSYDGERKLSKQIIDGTEMCIRDRSYGHHARLVQCGLCVHGTAPCKAYTDDHLRGWLPVRLAHLRK